MAISTNSLFHFTKKKKNLLNIFREGFKPHFCLEDLNPLKNRSDYTEGLEYAIPMVCFCDIPLTQTKDHMSCYGKYGIGLKKSWGVRNKIGPVLYAHNESEIFSALNELAYRNFLKRNDNNDIVKEDYAYVEWVMHWIGYFIKPYEGKLWRQGKYTNEIRFYNEREWRFVPPLSKCRFKYGMTKNIFLDISKRNEANREIWQQTVLRFGQEDINCIIVPRENQIPRFIEQMEQIKKYSEDDIKLLFSRVISAERIREDF